MIPTFIFISSTVVLLLSSAALFLLLRRKPETKMVGLTWTSDRATPKRALIACPDGILNRRIRRIACFQRPWSSRWFEQKTHRTIPTHLNNWLNNESRRVMQWK